MTLDLTSLTQSILTTVFNLGVDVVKDVIYVRPVSLAKETGESAVSEISAAVQAVIAASQSSPPGRVHDHERILIRAADINAISKPAAGDYIVQNSNRFTARRYIRFARSHGPGLELPHRSLAAPGLWRSHRARRCRRLERPDRQHRSRGQRSAL
jgi:hypothetical protein